MIDPIILALYGPSLLLHLSLGIAFGIYLAFAVRRHSRARFGINLAIGAFFCGLGDWQVASFGQVADLKVVIIQFAFSTLCWVGLTTLLLPSLDISQRPPKHRP